MQYEDKIADFKRKLEEQASELRAKHCPYPPHYVVAESQWNGVTFGVDFNGIVVTHQIHSMQEMLSQFDIMIETFAKTGLLPELKTDQGFEAYKIRTLKELEVRIEPYFLAKSLPISPKYALSYTLPSRANLDWQEAEGKLGIVKLDCTNRPNATANHTTHVGNITPSPQKGVV